MDRYHGKINPTKPDKTSYEEIIDMMVSTASSAELVVAEMTRKNPEDIQKRSNHGDTKMNQDATNGQ